MPFDLPSGDPQKFGFDQGQLDRLIATIERQIDDGWYPGCEIALARHGKLVLSRHFGHARIAPAKVKADADGYKLTEGFAALDVEKIKAHMFDDAV